MNLHGECVLIFVCFNSTGECLRFVVIIIVRAWGVQHSTCRVVAMCLRNAAKKRQIKCSTPLCGYPGNYHQATIKTGTSDSEDIDHWITI